MGNDSIEKLREEIDAIDDELVKLLLKRAGVTKKIYDVKKERNMKTLSATRDMQIFERITDGLNDLEADYLRQIYQEIFRASHSFLE